MLLHAEQTIRVCAPAPGEELVRGGGRLEEEEKAEVQGQGGAETSGLNAASIKAAKASLAVASLGGFSLSILLTVARKAPRARVVGSCINCSRPRTRAHAATP